MQTQKVDVVQLCEGLSSLVLKKGKFVRKLDGYDSQRDGTFSSGYREDGSVHELKTRNFTAELTKSRCSTWNLGADSVRSEERLRITYGKRSQCFVTHDLGGEVKRFGAEEMYQGTEEIKPEPWKVDSGKLPMELVANYLKRNLKKRNSKKTAVPKF
ncbi:MAG: hypothetical protein A3I26_00850 [Candidatus Yanofskybacteria bacterium RIFCSPLOWO2_02_FULL_43_10]|uniref:Uncharacterized protein n=1 Tax=Candidatus Yanofskybacteria bacterium RIFCSPLOWO2_12_FULL_43_11b TaxID=1802710 RepID=A0A1F8H9K2_9BACT|nr:MAG: hypothetical protein A2742_03030 [Candidatus Yanofskybacteria bacterium RIFCSPHIGHO2_01_FULL_43_32]OGN11436.1 MAG: hypothetical protein A3C69_01130 [Candidatus Yanofskybacteria bacterium RIFCSPHIGHO2_02_FULL_43_12]OGN17461.1 MAG: hypothetical protein A3E34_02075 [Candidatus Yanofskybacteria bacterium RIFCSPHIGHO2_12_FULL_43_11]OGN24916.1 MAG: hypothetical protein A2923_02800 [Candidatus Yanofskybacteria bacterium RIFCSPLOWO2_01_FULL_43_46]OGN29348.1 MAG: hypothetical protein A3I26_00850